MLNERKAAILVAKKYLNWDDKYFKNLFDPKYFLNKIEDPYIKLMVNSDMRVARIIPFMPNILPNK